MNKYKIPLAVSSVIEPIIRENKQLFEVIIEDGCFYSFIAKNNNDFYFKLISTNDNATIDKITNKLKPRNEKSVMEYNEVVPFESAISNFKIWITLLEKYESLSSIYDDPILINYEREFEREIGLLMPEDIDNYFSMNQQLFLEAYFTRLIDKIDEYKDEYNAQEVEIIKLEASKIIKILPRLNIKQGFAYINKIMAMGRKAGLKYWIPFYKDSQSEARKALIKVIINKSPELLDVGKKWLESQFYQL